MLPTSDAGASCRIADAMSGNLGEDGLMYYSVEFVGIRFVAQERASSMAVVIGETVL